jgi:hypothetical protein
MRLRVTTTVLQVQVPVPELAPEIPAAAGVVVLADRVLLGSRLSE